MSCVAGFAARDGCRGLILLDMSEIIRAGTEVSWRWGSGTGNGKVTEVHHDSVTRTLKGSEITRNGSDDNPAYVIETDDGATVLKLRSEVERL